MAVAGDGMRTIFLAGGIASGKSTVARRMAEHGAWRCDLDEVSRRVCEPGSPVLDAIATEFGDDVIVPETGELDRALLASRAFESPEDAAALEAIELPAIAEELARILTTTCCAATPPVACVVEVPLLDRMGDLMALADDVVAVIVPRDVRRERAVERGMDPADFDRRDAGQPTEEYLREHATSLIENDGDLDDLLRAVDEWWAVNVGGTGGVDGAGGTNGTGSVDGVVAGM